jgi:hypothetical protein
MLKLVSSCPVRRQWSSMGMRSLPAPADIVVIGSATSHRFTAIGDERLDMVCVHASDRFVIEWLND